MNNINTSEETSRAPVSGAFAVMQVVVTIAIIVVLVALAVPIISSFNERAQKQVALEKMRKLGGALSNYVGQNGGVFPAEDVAGDDTWYNAARPDAKDAWYNALPRSLGQKGTGDYAGSPASFYTDENLLFLPGANYPDKKKIINPMFAIAFNTKLQRNDASGKKQRTRMDQISQPAKTVAFLEQGLLNEDRTLDVQSRKDYDGSPKGSAKSFVGRYSGKGFLVFMDGRVELVAARDLLTETGAFPFPQNDVIWTRTPEENPNKDATNIGSSNRRDDT